MTKRVAWFTGEPSVKGCFTPYKVYEVVLEGVKSFNVINDKGGQNNCLKKGCAHICHGDWVFADVVDEETKVEIVKVEEVKRKGVMTLLPEDSKFEIGQRVQVDRSGYIGYTTIIGYNYDYDEYATECDENSGCSHDCDGLAEKMGFGLWVAESDIIESVEAKQPKWSEWIENTTGKQPVADGIVVKTKFARGSLDKDKAEAYWWADKALTHYKVKLKDVSSDTPKEQEKPKSKWTKNTGVRPVEGNITVMMKFSDGTIDKTQAQKYCWDLGQSRKIIKWRLV